MPVRGGSRRAHLREWRRESLWLWPALAAVAAWVAGDIAARYLHSFTFHEGLFPTNLDDARTLLATIAAALLTFTGVVFSITLVALQMSSTQYSPRVLRTFVRKPVTKLALATFIATFVYSLTLLARVGTTTAAHTVPQGAVGLAYLLVMASVLVFVVFVHSTVRSMRVSYVIQAVFNETLQAIQTLFVPASAYREVPQPVLEGTGCIVPFDRGDAVLDGVDAHHLAEVATTAFLRGAALRPGRDVHGAGIRSARRCTAGRRRRRASSLGTLDCSAVRTLYQDPCYGVRQLVDIAIRAVVGRHQRPDHCGAERSIGCTGSCGPSPTARTPRASFSIPPVRSAWWCPSPTGTGCSISPSPRSGSTAPGDPQISRKLMAIFDDLPDRESR